ncbi:MAG: hypothetical protein QXJ70_05100 [Acidilobaceae archaeon]
MLIYNHVLRKLGNARISNSKLLIDKNTLYILLAVRRSVEVSKHKNKLVIDINGDNIACLLIDYDRCIAVFFTLNNNISRLRVNYRRIRRYIQKKVKNTFEKNGLLEKYRTREKRRVEDIVKKVTTTLVETARVYSADIVRENLRDMKMNSKKVSRK